MNPQPETMRKPSVRFLLSAVQSVEFNSDPTPRQAGLLRMYGMGAANVRIGLRPDTRVQTLVGVRDVQQIALGVDDPAAFVRTLRERLLP